MEWNEMEWNGTVAWSNLVFPSIFTEYIDDTQHININTHGIPFSMEYYNITIRERYKR